VDPRAARELLPRRSIVLVVDHEEEVGRREEEFMYKESGRKLELRRAIVRLFVYYCADATTWITMPGIPDYA
jgi:hypothetical protein